MRQEAVRRARINFRQTSPAELQEDGGCGPARAGGGPAGDAGDLSRGGLADAASNLIEAWEEIRPHMMWDDPEFGGTICFPPAERPLRKLLNAAREPGEHCHREDG
jgi:hypothetical protein